MPTHIRFRMNKITGEVEEFLVDDQDRNLPEAEHDRIAAEAARVISRHPLIHEVTGPVIMDSEVRPDVTGVTEGEQEPTHDEPVPVHKGKS